MDSNTLLNYLRAVLKLETERRTLFISMERNRQQAASLAANPGITTPEVEYFSDSEGASKISTLLFFISIPLLALYWWAYGSDGISDIISGNLTSAQIFIFILITIIFAGPPVGCLIGAVILNSKSQHLYQDARKKYDQVVADNEKFFHEKDRTLSLLNQDYQILKQHHNKVCSTLQEYYKLDILYPKYRGLVPVSMFVQYFASGRVSKLEGHTGAYNLYEQELLQRVIIAKLDVVISRLDEIQTTQYELAQALQESNQKIVALSNRVDIANQHLEVQSYNSIQTNEEVKALKDYTMFRDLFR